MKLGVWPVVSRAWAIFGSNLSMQKYSVNTVISSHALVSALAGLPQEPKRDYDLGMRIIFMGAL